MSGTCSSVCAATYAAAGYRPSRTSRRTTTNSSRSAYTTTTPSPPEMLENHRHRKTRPITCACVRARASMYSTAKKEQPTSSTAKRLR